MSVEYYRTSDPLENFQLRLVVREFSRSNVYKPAIIKGVSDESDAADESAQPLLAENASSGGRSKAANRHREWFNVDRKISWQEKILGPSEIADYLINKDNRRGTAYQVGHTKLSGTLDHCYGHFSIISSLM